MTSGPRRTVSILLAAGEGRRIGGNKGLLRVEGAPALERLVRITQASRVDDLIVVTGSCSKAVGTIAESCNARHVENTGWKSGMTSSIKTGISALPDACEAFLIHPVDHMLTTVEDLDELVRAWEGHPRSHEVILRPVHEQDRGHPVLFSRRFAREFLALGDDEPGHTVYRRHLDKVLEVPVTNPHIRFDIDSPEDLARVEQILASRR